MAFHNAAIRITTTTPFYLVPTIMKQCRNELSIAALGTHTRKQSTAVVVSDNPPPGAPITPQKRRKALFTRDSSIMLDSDANPDAVSSAYLLRRPPQYIPIDEGQKLLGETEDIFDTPKTVACGNLRKDFQLCTDVYNHFGLMLRPQTLQMICQLEAYSKQKDERTGDLTIPQRGLLLDGVKGAGKHLVWWAKTHGWIVFYESEPDRYMRNCASIVRANSGLYIQEQFAHECLKTFTAANASLLRRLPVQRNAYGRVGLDGSYTRWSRRVFEPTIKTSVRYMMQKDPAFLKHGVNTEFMEKADIKSVALYKKQMLFEQQLRSLVRTSSLIEALPNPETVLDIAQAGITDSVYAVAALAEIFQQLRVQTAFPVLLAIDNINSVYWVSHYVSARYDLTKYGGYIPGIHLALPRLFSRWDGGNYRRGIKIAAVTWSRGIKRRAFDPRLLGPSRSEVVGIPQFSALEFENYVRYMAHKSAVVQFPEAKIPYYYMMTSGNGEKARKTLATFY